MLLRILRGAFGLLGAAAGFYVGRAGLNLWQVGGGVNPPPGLSWTLLALVTFVAGLVGYGVAQHIINLVTQSMRWLEGRLQRTPAQEIISGALGLICGLIIANLLGASFFHLPLVGPYIPMVGSILFGYLGWSLGTKRRDEVWSLFNIFPRWGGKERDKGKGESVRSGAKILDTSVIIDGRIADIIKSGFIEGTIVIPAFVLEELRHIADSSDLLKRNRGRRGLDILNKIRKETGITVKVSEVDFDDLTEVDSKLVRLAQKMGAPVLTNDYNLNKVAELQGVRVLNINELANAVKPVVLPGEEMTVQVIKDGKEMGQGVAYLDDGTMIVVENGRRFIGQTIAVLVTSVLQTAAGRMIFARPKAADRKLGAHHQALERSEYQCLS
ncbi:PIN/TRAM domain-containing protein [Neomoorella thermoacetica]|uniref:PIN and TRAM-domain containing protein n=3 Tax=Neomoorella thermoacetica TaxID=1525 RepID=A0A1D7XF22_NEOTH|nr:PIN/TRAM domain-containing protein [Moorella thermoacetica]AKX95349.1 putative PIN and TRAM-domain containing protein precursor [Moorella thermoacetica]AKX97974.1 putative PIN and TRAM-domain containing protein precursor [Moorella thermoacetica]AOQ25462.1 putative PIN and TRAM-domain containing protein precursor [Moorella thermoacetica]APC09687.1 putative PIN and TRAM-domain containing protein precursor [Moorella thermoacetica]OIQ10153.1 putative PIN and TRAM-domain containing protein precu